MTAKSIQLTSSERLVAVEHTQLELVGAAEIPYQVLTSGVFVLPVGAAPEPLAKYLASSAPSIEMGIDGSVTPVDFDLAPASGQIFRIDRLRLVLVAAGALGLSGFGDLAALANGLALEVLNSDDVQVYDLLDGQPIKSGNDLLALGKVELLEPGTDHTLVAEITPATPIRLHGEGTKSVTPRKLRATVADNLSTLTRLRLIAIGCEEATKA